MYVKLKDSKIAQYASFEEEGAGLCASRAFFVLFCACCPFLSFSLSLGVGGWLRFAIVAFPGLFVFFILLEFKKYVQFRFQP